MSKCGENISGYHLVCHFFVLDIICDLLLNWQHGIYLLGSLGSFFNGWSKALLINNGSHLEISDLLYIY